MTWQTVVTTIVVVVAGLYLGARLYRAVRRPNCGCGDGCNNDARIVSAPRCRQMIPPDQLIGRSTDDNSDATSP